MSRPAFEISRRGFLQLPAALAAGAARHKIAFVAGPRSHGFGDHEHNAGCLLLAKCLNENVPGVEAVVQRDGWPEDPRFFDGAKAIVIFADGSRRSLIVPHLAELEKLMGKGVGLAVLHYALDVPKGEAGDRLLEWIGGYYEQGWSVNPSWTARFDHLPRHAVTSGVRPFALFDEWYCHMRFRANLDGVTPLLTAIPPDAAHERPMGPHSNNPVFQSRKGMPEHLSWAYQGAGGRRGFGFTGGHFHWAWGHDDFRKLVLNGILWTAGIEVPAGGVPSRTPTFAELLANQDDAMPEGFGPEQAQEKIRPR